MDGPWTQYQGAAAEDGPWTAYAKPAAPVEPAAPMRGGGRQDASGSIIPVPGEPTLPSGPTFSTAEKLARGTVLPVKGAAESLAETAGAPLDLFWTAWQKLGLPGPTPGAATQSLKAPIEALAGGIKPETESERIAEAGGRGAADVATTLIPATALAKGAKAGSLVQRGAAAMAAQPAAQAAIGATANAVQEATDEPGAGLATAVGIPLAGAAARRLVSPVANRLAPQEQKLVEAAKAEGIDLTPGQRTGSRPLQATESSLTQMPFSAGPQARVYDKQRQQFNRAVLSRAGIQADRASPEVLDAGFKRLGSQFDNLAAKTTVNIDQPFEREIIKIGDDYTKQLSADQTRVMQSYLEEMRNATNYLGQKPQIDGQTFQNIHSKISTRIREADDDHIMKRALYQLNHAFDDAMTRSMPPGSAAQWKNTRREYSNLMRVDEAMRGGTQADRAQANIPFGAFKDAVKNANQSGFSRGRGELNELARIGDFLAAKIPNSGTAERTRAMQMLSGSPALGLTAGVGTGTGDPLMAAITAAGTLGIPPAVQKFLNSEAGRFWMSNQLGRGLGPRSTLGMATSAAIPQTIDFGSSPQP